MKPTLVPTRTIYLFWTFLPLLVIMSFIHFCSLLGITGEKTNTTTNDLFTLSRPCLQISDAKWVIYKPTPKPKTPLSLLSEERPSYDFKFGHNIHSVHPKKSPLKILEKRQRGRIQGLYRFFGCPIISGTAKTTNFCTYIHRIDRNKCPLKVSGKVAVDDWQTDGRHAISIPRYALVHRAVISHFPT